MLKLFGVGKPDHPMADLKAARKIVEESASSDPYKALEELAHWLESVRTLEGFKPDYRAQLVLLIDDATQAPIRKLSRDYLATPRQSRFAENRMWGAIHEALRQSALAFATCIDAFATGQKGGDALKGTIGILCARALRSLAAQTKWQYLRYGPFENSVWGVIARIYALAESRQFSRTMVQMQPGVPGESSPEREFLRAVMLAASSPDSLLPLDIEIAERLIAHFASMFTLSLDQQPDIAYWMDLANGNPPLRLARPPQGAPSLRYFAASGAAAELERLLQAIRRTHAIPSDLNLGGTYEAQQVLDVLEHLAIYWSPKPPERRAPRHSVKSRLTVNHGFDGAMSVLEPGSTPFDDGAAESWIVENVSTGGFGASVPQIKGDWLRIGKLLAMQPEGGENWVLGVIRRLHRETVFKGLVGIEALARSASLMHFRIVNGATAGDTETGILLNSLGGTTATSTSSETRVILRPGALLPGQNLELDQDGMTFLLMPQGAPEAGEDYEIWRFRPMVRDTVE